MLKKKTSISLLLLSKTCVEENLKIQRQFLCGWENYVEYLIYVLLKFTNANQLLVSTFYICSGKQCVNKNNKKKKKKKKRQPTSKGEACVN